MKIVEKFKGLMGRGRDTLKNEKGLTLLEMLIAILIFILATVLIISLVSNALDKPKEAGVRSAMSSYESAAQLILLETSGDIPGIDEAEMIEEFNKEVDPTAVFDPTTFETAIENAYGNPYIVEIAKDPSTYTASIEITSIGAKADKIYTTTIYYIEGEVHITTDGFGRNDKDISDEAKTKLGL